MNEREEEKTKKVKEERMKKVEEERMKKVTGGGGEDEKR